MPDVIFRFDASPRLGGGHAARCGALGEAFTAAGLSVGSAVNRDAVGFVDALMPGAPTIVEAPDGEALRAAFTAGCRILVVDHYGWSAEQERACRGWADRILVLDDLVDRPHDCDLLADPTPGRWPSDYAGLTPSGSVVRTGPAYAPLRRTFPLRRTEALRRRNAGADGAGDPTDELRLLIAFGMGDHLELTVPALEAVRGLEGIAAVDVTIGSAAPGIERVRALAAETPGVRLYEDADDMAALIAAADLGLGAAGGSSWERCCLGLPTLAVRYVENQIGNAAALSDAGAARLLGGPESCTPAALRAALAALIANPAARTDMARAAARLCDGRGAARLALEAVPERAGDGAPVVLRPAEEADRARVLAWQREPGARAHFRNPDPPDEAAHAAWWSARMAGAEPGLEIVERAGEPVGFVRLDPAPDGSATGEEAPAADHEVSILLAGAARGGGVGRAALAALSRLVPGETLAAEVLPANAASRSLFLAAGYREERPGWFLKRERGAA